MELLQNIQEDDSDAESNIKSDTDVYDLHEDNCNNSKSESSSDNQLLVSESNSEISSFVDMETNFEMDKDLVHQDNTTSARITGIFWTLIKTILEDNLATTLSQKLLGHPVIINRHSRHSTGIIGIVQA